MKIEPVQVDGWAAPRGYSNAVRVDSAQRLVFIAGQIAWDKDQKLVGAGDFARQFGQALSNVVALTRAAGGGPEHIVRMTVYVTDKQRYLAALKEIGVEWRSVMGRNYPAMALVQVADLLEEGAMVEIEATAAIG